MADTIFDKRNFNEDEKNAIRNCVNDAIDSMNQIKDLQDHMNEMCKELADRLNENAADAESKVKPTLFKAMAKAYIKNKEDIEKSKTALDEVETALEVIFHM